MNNLSFFMYVYMYELEQFLSTKKSELKEVSLRQILTVLLRNS